MSTAAAVLVGWVADAVAGDPARWHPVADFGRLADVAERCCYADDRLAGAAYTLALVAAPTLAAHLTARRAGTVGRNALLAAGIWAALGARSLRREARRVAGAVADGDLAEARRRLPALVGRDPTALDAGELCRAVTESVAENTADAVVAPLLYGAVLGPAGVVAHRCANTLDAMVGHHSPRYERFGWAAARLDDLLAWLPARATALLAALLAPAVGGSPLAAVRVWRRDGATHPSPNAGRCEAAFAGALGVRLGGINRYGERVEARGPFGDGGAPSPGDVERAVRLSALVGAAAALLASAAAAAVHPWQKAAAA